MYTLQNYMNWKYVVDQETCLFENPMLFSGESPSVKWMKPRHCAQFILYRREFYGSWKTQFFLTVRRHILMQFRIIFRQIHLNIFNKIWKTFSQSFKIYRRSLVIEIIVSRQDSSYFHLKIHTWLQIFRSKRIACYTI